MSLSKDVSYKLLAKNIRSGMFIKTQAGLAKVLEAEELKKIINKRQVELDSFSRASRYESRKKIPLLTKEEIVELKKNIKVWLIEGNCTYDISIPAIDEVEVYKCITSKLVYFKEYKKDGNIVLEDKGVNGEYNNEFTLKTKMVLGGSQTCDFMYPKQRFIQLSIGRKPIYLFPFGRDLNYIVLRTYMDPDLYLFPSPDKIFQNEDVIRPVWYDYPQYGQLHTGKIISLPKYICPGDCVNIDLQSLHPKFVKKVLGSWHFDNNQNYISLPKPLDKITFPNTLKKYINPFINAKIDNIDNKVINPNIIKANKFLYDNINNCPEVLKICTNYFSKSYNKAAYTKKT